MTWCFITQNTWNFMWLVLQNRMWHKIEHWRKEPRMCLVIKYFIRHNFEELDKTKKKLLCYHQFHELSRWQIIMCFIFVIIIIIIINTNSNNKNIIYLYYSGNLYIFCLSNTLNDCVSGQAETSGRTAEPKVSTDNFHPIRILGEGGFRKVILVKKKPSDGCDQRFAIIIIIIFIYWNCVVTRWQWLFYM